MTEAVQVALVVLAALLIGALLPVLFEARLALRQTRRLVNGAGPQLIKAIEEMSGVMGKVDLVISELEPRVHALAESVDKVQKLWRGAVAIGATVGPIVAAAVRSFASNAANHDVDREPAEMHEHSAEQKGD